MDVATNRDLLDFIDGFDVKEKDTSLNTKVCNREEEKEEEADVWQAVADALSNLTQRILDTESRCRATSEKITRNNRRVVKETATGWIFNSSRSGRVALYC